MRIRKTLILAIMLALFVETFCLNQSAHGQYKSASDGNSWLEASSKIYETNTYSEFNVTIMAKSISQDDHLLGIQFALSYDPSAFEVTHVYKGSFLTQWAPHDTFASWNIRNDIGWVAYGEMILPSDKGVFDLTAWPNGDGDVASITFKPTFMPNIGSVPLQYNIELQPMFDNIFLDNNGLWVPYASPIGTAYTYTFNFEHKLMPEYGEVMFEAPEFPNFTPTYTWNFGDGSEITTTNPTIVHAFLQPRSYNVTLTTYIQEQSATLEMSRMVQVTNAAQPINVKVDCGPLYFNGEKADFYITVSDSTQRLDPTTINAILYRSGTPIADLTNTEVQLDIGLYEVTYNIPVDAQAGTYTLFIEAKTYAFSDTTLKSFEISPTITGFISNVNNGIITVSNGLRDINLNAATINATITGLITNANGEVLARIDTAIGPLTARLDTIGATVTRIDGNTATLSTTLGDVKVNVDALRAQSFGGPQSTTTVMLLAVAIFSVIAVILALAFLTFARKK